MSDHLTKAYRQFAAALKVFFDPSDPLFPNKKLPIVRVSEDLKMSRQAIHTWLRGDNAPQTEQTFEDLMRVLDSRAPGYDAEKKELRKAWAAVELERKNKALLGVSTGVSESVTWLRGLVIPNHSLIYDVRFTLENIVDVLACGKLDSYSTTELVSALGEVPHPESIRLTSSLTHILLEKTSNTAHMRIQEIVASTISKHIMWRPSERDVKALLEMCHSNLASSAPRFQIISPLSVGLMRTGCPDALRQTINLNVVDDDCGKHDFSVLGVYYPGELSRFRSILRHFDDPARKGLIWGNETNSLIRMANSPTLPIERKRIIKPRLLQCAQLLYNADLSEAARLAETAAYNIR